MNVHESNVGPLDIVVQKEKAFPVKEGFTWLAKICKEKEMSITS